MQLGPRWGEVGGLPVDKVGPTLLGLCCEGCGIADARLNIHDTDQ